MEWQVGQRWRRGDVVREVYEVSPGWVRTQQIWGERRTNQYTWTLLRINEVSAEQRWQLVQAAPLTGLEVSEGL